METTILDHVVRYPTSGLDVLVVGGGIGGLMTALECWRKGHNVTVLEKSPHAATIGDAIIINPSGWSALPKYPTMMEELTKISIDAQRIFYNLDGSIAGPPLEFEHNMKGAAEHAAFPLHIGALLGRADLAQMLLDQCERLEIPIHWDVNIVDYGEGLDVKKGFAIRADGHRYTADVVIAADGLGSKSHRITMGQQTRAVSTGYVIYRSVIPLTGGVSEILFDTVQKSGRGEFRLYMGHNMHIALVLSKRLVTFAITLPDDNQGTATESWSSFISSAKLLQSLPPIDKLDPLIVAMLKSLPEDRIVAWKLCMRNPQPTWSSPGGHVVQVGDSAHSYIPTSGSGGTMALEDSASIAECLRLGAKGNICNAVKVHELLRKQRVTLLQRMGLAVRSSLHAKETESPKDAPEIMLQGKWLWAHNPELYARDNFDRATLHLRNKEPFQNTNLPKGYVYEDWTLEGEIERETSGRSLDIHATGDWSIN
ncbi:unnamed protein product [Clonostachys solani]|uniref:FAD dependent oxidoreductase domain-containing protein n=1 Tax=Clonostachys solani TaxID=160281 RepID=A0A9P0ELF0_9HYPO|nr:unnamed protein product [Clonostachys solani]